MRLALRARSHVFGFIISAFSLAALASAQEVGRPSTGELGVTETVDEIMARQHATYPGDLGRILRNMERPPLRPEREIPGYRERPQNPNAPAIASYPPRPAQASAQFLAGLDDRTPRAYTVGTTFTGATLGEAFSFPPDSMGDVGPTQIVVATNGLIRSFDRNGAMGALNADLDVFFNSVRNGAFTTDPQVRFDRLTNRWYVMCINIPLQGNNVLPNRVLIAVSSGPTITGTGSFTFYFFDQELVGPTPNADTGEWIDYPSLGIDNNALYIGGNMFTFGGSYGNSTLFVVRKSSIQTGGPIVVTPFRSLVSGSGGPVTPRGVDNDDPAATIGYVIAPDAAVFSKLVLRRISNPGGVPTISGDIGLNVPLTTFPINVSALGSAANPFDGLDDRIFQAKILFNKLTGTRTLWTAHSMEVDASGTASTVGNRNGSRWYEIKDLATVPALVQAGTVFSNAGASPDSFWVPSLAMNLQGHAMLGCSIAGAARRAEIAATTRFSSDALGSMRPPEIVQTSVSNYNLEAGVQRWGDYSSSVVDPKDGMSVWTFQEYCHSTDNWGVRVVQLKAPPPANIQSVSQTNLVRGSTVNVNVTGTSVNGSAFFDPGAGYPSHIAASVSGTGVTINSVTFNNGTSLTLNISTASNATLGNRNLTITNPDGQAVTMNNAFNVVLPPTQTVLPDAYTVLNGSESSHNLSAFLQSDDVRHTVQANSTQGFKSLVEFHGVSPFTTVARISFILESATNFPDRRRMVHLFNTTNSQWELLSTTPIPLTDGTVQVDVTTNPSRFINATTGEVLARVECDFPSASRSLSRSFEFFDRAVWEVQQ